MDTLDTLLWSKILGYLPQVKDWLSLTQTNKYIYRKVYQNNRLFSISKDRESYTVDLKGKRNGVSITYDWGLSIVQNYKNDKLDGLSITRCNGRITKYRYRDGLKHGISKIYKDEKLHTVHKYKKDLLHGLTKIIEPTKISICNYKFGLKQGRETIYPNSTYRSKQPIELSHYIRGERHGLQKIRFFNGISKEYYAKDGKREGEYKRWYPDGKLSKHAWYKNGKKHGRVLKYFINGALHLDLNFKDGIKHGSYHCYHGTGCIFIICNYVEGKIEGELREYHDKRDSPVKLIGWYKEDKLVEFKEFRASSRWKS